MTRPVNRLARLFTRIAATASGALFSDREAGQGIAEYAMILALIIIVAVVVLIFFGGQVKTIVSAASGTP